MEVIRVLNNNAVLCTDGRSQAILLGRGLGFGKRLGDEIDAAKADQVFVPNAAQTIANLTQLSVDIPLEMIQLAADLSQLAGKKRSQSLILGLADHISFAIERTQRGISIDYPLRWEIAQLFPEEFKLGQKALAWVAQRTGWQLPADEAALITMHFVNARFSGHGAVSAFPHILTEILETVENGIGYPLDRESIDVARFVTHLRYLLVRLAQGQLADGPIANLGDAIEREMPESFTTARLVAGVLDASHGKLSPNEIVYLALHIERLRRATNKNLP